MGGRVLSDKQVEMLEQIFREERKLETVRKVHLAAEHGIDPKQFAVWFQNRRARHKSKLLMEEFAKLKQAHDAAILHKCHLGNEVMRLKERLMLAEEELTRFRSAGCQSHAVSGDGGDVMGRAVCSRSLSSSFSTGTCHQTTSATAITWWTTTSCFMFLNMPTLTKAWSSGLASMHGLM